MVSASVTKGHAHSTSILYHKIVLTIKQNNHMLIDEPNSTCVHACLTTSVCPLVSSASSGHL